MYVTSVASYECTVNLPLLEAVSCKRSVNDCLTATNNVREVDAATTTDTNGNNTDASASEVMAKDNHRCKQL